ncbi:MAG: NUDIX hydrolase [bacterium]|nr:NUDIX hydrolase [bacterium]
MEEELKVSVDGVVFGYSKESGVNLLLIKRKYPPFEGKWALPGGFLKSNENLDQAIERELKEETGLSINYLEQLYTFGELKRDPRTRVITVAYFGLINSEAYKELNATTDASEAKWFNVENLPDLAFDHDKIIKVAFKRLRLKVQYEPIGFELLGDKFPFSDLEILYNSLLESPIDRRNFKKKVMSYGIIDELDEYAQQKGAGRPAKLYKFNKEIYKHLQEKGIYFEIN